MDLFAKAAGIERDLARLPNPADRARVRNASLGNWRMQARYWTDVTLAAGLIIAVEWLVVGIRPIRPGLLIVAISVPILLSGLPVVLAHAIWNRKFYCRLVRSHLRQYDLRLCLECGYDLQGSASDCCPECGELDRPIVFPVADGLPLSFKDRVRIRLAGLSSQLSMFGDDVAQRRAWRAACRACEGRQATLAIIILPVALVIAVFGAVLIPVIGPLLGFASTHLLIAYFGALGILFVAAAVWSDAALLRRELRKLRESVSICMCEECGYDLRATTEPRCPECGAAFTVGSAINPAKATDKPVQRENAIDRDELHAVEFTSDLARSVDGRCLRAEFAKIRLQSRHQRAYALELVLSSRNPAKEARPCVLIKPLPSCGRPPDPARLASVALL